MWTFTANFEDFIQNDRSDWLLILLDPIELVSGHKNVIVSKPSTAHNGKIRSTIYTFVISNSW